MQKEICVYLNGEKLLVPVSEIKARKAAGQRYIYLEDEKMLVPVTDAVYKEYMRPDWREQKRRQREQRCTVDGKRCQKDCNYCEYSPDGAALSLERLEEDLGKMAVDKVDVAEHCMMELFYQALYDAINELTSEDKKIIKLLFNEMSEREIAAEVSLSQTGVNKRKHRLFEFLRARLEKYI